MSVRADWKLADALAEDEDPFAAVIYTSGIEIDLTASEDELVEQLRELGQAEARLAMRGITCPLKDAGQHCGTCPSATLDATVRRSQLCRVGKDEVAVWAAGEARHAARRAPLLELALIADEMSEVGHLSDEYAELLVAAGL